MTVQDFAVTIEFDHPLGEVREEAILAATFAATIRSSQSFGPFGPHTVVAIPVTALSLAAAVLWIPPALSLIEHIAGSPAAAVSVDPLDD